MKARPVLVSQHTPSYFYLGLLLHRSLLSAHFRLRICSQKHRDRSKSMAHPFHVLKLHRFATKDQVRKQYKKLALQYHPDKANPSDIKAATRKFQQIKDAYDHIILGKLYAPDVRPGRYPNFMQEKTEQPQPAAEPQAEEDPDSESENDSESEPEKHHNHESSTSCPQLDQLQLDRLSQINTLLIRACDCASRTLETSRRPQNANITADAYQNILRLFRILRHVRQTKRPCRMRITAIIGYILYFIRKLTVLAKYGGRGSQGRFFCTEVAHATKIVPPLLNRQEMDEVIWAFDAVHKVDLKCCLSNWQKGMYDIRKDFVPKDVDIELRLWRKWIDQEGNKLHDEDWL